MSEVMDFLRLLDKHPAGATRSALPIADREQDRIRQRCKREGWAVWRYGRWQITRAGRFALQSPSPPGGETP